MTWSGVGLILGSVLVFWRCRLYLFEVDSNSLSPKIENLLKILHVSLIVFFAPPQDAVKRKRRKRRTKGTFLRKKKPKCDSPTFSKGSHSTLTTVPTQGLYNEKDRTGKILSFNGLNTKMAEVAGIEPACRSDLLKTSTCLFHLIGLIVLLATNGQVTEMTSHP